MALAAAHMSEVGEGGGGVVSGKLFDPEFPVRQSVLNTCQAVILNGVSFTDDPTG